MPYDTCYRYQSFLELYYGDNSQKIYKIKQIETPSLSTTEISIFLSVNKYLTTFKFPCLEAEINGVSSLI